MKVNAVREVYLVGRCVRVLFVDKLKDASGLCETYNATIYISQEGNDDWQRSILWHELVHAMHAFGVPVQEGSVDEEGAVLACELGLMSLFNDPRNKWAIDFLTGATKAPRRKK